MSKTDILDEIENYLETLGVCSATAAEYASIGFRIDDIPSIEWRDLIFDLQQIAPLKEWVHTHNSVYSITHIDDQQFPVILDKDIYEKNIRPTDRQVS